MKRRTLLLGGLVTALIVWFASDELRWPARLFVALLLGPLPVLFMLQAHAADALPTPLPRLRVYAGSLLALWLLAAVAFLVGVASGFPPRVMGFVSLSPRALVGWTTGALAAATLVVLLFRKLQSSETDIMRQITPVTPAEKGVFVFLSISAGVCEETAFRGVLLPALATATGSMAGGLLLSSLAFGVMHAHQHWNGALRASILGALLAAPVLATGSLYASMAAHALIDVIGGLWLARWLFR